MATNSNKLLVCLLFVFRPINHDERARCFQRIEARGGGRWRHEERCFVCWQSDMRSSLQPQKRNRRGYSKSSSGRPRLYKKRRCFHPLRRLAWPLNWSQGKPYDDNQTVGVNEFHTERTLNHEQSLLLSLVLIGNRHLRLACSVGRLERGLARLNPKARLVK